jgi:hypothetical protein
VGSLARSSLRLLSVVPFLASTFLTSAIHRHPAATPPPPHGHRRSQWWPWRSGTCVCGVDGVDGGVCDTRRVGILLESTWSLLLYAPLLPRVRRCLIRDQHGTKTFFKIRRDIKLSKVFSAYSKRRGVEVTSLRFTFEGQRLDENDTPGKLDISEGDQIDVFQEQTGGC